MQGKRRMQQGFQFGHFAHAGQFLEHAVYIFTDIRLCGHQAIIGVHPGIPGMIVPSPQMGIAQQLLIFTADNQNHFGMSLIAHDAIHYHCPGFLQDIGHHNIGFFIKTCPQFNYGRDFLAITGGFGQHLNNFRIRTTTVQGLLNGQHTRVFSRFPQQGNHRLE